MTDQEAHNQAASDLHARVEQEVRHLNDLAAEAKELGYQVRVFHFTPDKINVTISKIQDPKLS